MRPLRLVIEGFTCFKDKQPPLDFTPLELFAITGPTGAGKTSILDAIIFALYGKVPRVGKTYRELISLGRDRLSVRFEFEMGRRRFRVVRTGRRGRSGEAQLEEIDGGRDKPIASGVHQVDDEITNLLGLRYDAFTQAVVLPQGEFARFLKSPPSDRREILRDLLKLQIYERMRQTAFQQAKGLAGEAKTNDEILSRDYEDATPENLETKKSDLANQEKKNRKLEVKRSAAERELEEVRRLHGKSVELADERKRLLELEKLEPQMDEYTHRLALARKVEPVVPLLDAADEAKRLSKTEEERVQKTALAFEKAKKALETAKTQLQKARDDSQEIPKLKERIRALDKVMGLLEPREIARRRLSDALEVLERINKEEASASADLSRVGRLVEERTKEFESARRELESVSYDEELDRLLEELREPAVQLGARRKGSAETSAELEYRETQRDQMEAKASKAEEATQQSRNDLKRAEQRRGRAEASLRDAERQHSAAHLRHHLEEGKKCPVCEQKVKALPPPLQFALIETLSSQFEEAQEAVREARLTLENKNRDAAAIRAELDAAEQEIKQLQEKREDSTRDSERVEKELRNRIESRLTIKEGELVEDRIVSEAKKQAQLRDRHADATKSVRKLDKSLDEARNDLDRLKTQVEVGRNKREDLQGKIKEAKDEIAGYDKQIDEVTTSPDPKVEADESARRIEGLEKALETAQDNERRQSNETTTAETTYEEARRTAEEAADRSRTAAERAQHAIAHSDFENEEAARNAQLTVGEQSKIDREVTEFRQKLHAVKQRTADLERELNGLVVTGEDLDSKEKEVAKLRKDYDDGLDKAGGLRQEIKELDQKLKRAEEIRRELERLRDRHSIYSSLANDLRSEHFQAYLLEEAFRELVEGASERLKKLSGRYTLEYREDSFHVLDHENAGERRSADTLSGGETFLASLALALELSEQVQRAAGAVNLDSLFIDEGFGTLDSETLDTVAAAIESLPVGGRMVGIITHIRELTERLPACIRVEKATEGSRILPD
jgi:exonuclease SbcC